jgi:hypothetical protein
MGVLDLASLAILAILSVRVGLFTIKWGVGR